QGLPSVRCSDPPLPMRHLHAIRNPRLARPKGLTVLGAPVLLLPLLVACGRPDARGLQTLACQQAAASLDMRSLSQLDALRKLLGVAPDVDPLSVCRELGVTLEQPAQPTSPEEPAEEKGTSD
ncbi:MAG: hypothetical protein ACO262_10960, partial [Vulcanococcus sp.]